MARTGFAINFAINKASVFDLSFLLLVIIGEERGEVFLV